MDSGDSRPGGRFQYGILMDPLMTVLSRVWRTWRKRATCLCHQLTKGIGGALEEEPFSARRNGMLVASH